MDTATRIFLMSSPLKTLSERQQSLLNLLLLNRAGMTVDELAQAIDISRNAVNQHLANLEALGFIQNKVQPSTGGRPSKAYTLTSAGAELFPRHYDLFANMLIRLLHNKLGEQELSRYMVELGEMIASQYQGQFNGNEMLEEKITKLVQIMVELGYEAHSNIKADGLTEIIADNCVFHQLAAECETVCELDIALISSALNDVSVDHQECIVRGGSCCRFAITQK